MAIVSLQPSNPIEIIPNNSPIQEHSHDINFSGHGDDFISVETSSGPNSASISLHHKTSFDKEEIEIKPNEIYNHNLPIPSFKIDKAGHIIDFSNVFFDLSEYENSLSKEELEEINEKIESKVDNVAIKDLVVAINNKAEKSEVSTKLSREDLESYNFVNQETFSESIQQVTLNKADKTDLLSHINQSNNPHNITPAQIGTYSTSEIDTLLNRKEDLPYLNIYNGEGGNPRAIRFATADYSSCNSNNGIYAKISLMSGHGNGVSYCFLEDVFIKVAYHYVDENSKPTIQVNNFKYYESEVDGNPQKYGDVYWTVDESARKVYFYVLAGQWSHVYQSPWRRLSWSTGGNIIQDTTCVYSDGRPQNWANNTRYAMENEVPSNKETWTFTLEDGSTVTKEVYVG